MSQPVPELHAIGDGGEAGTPPPQHCVSTTAHLPAQGCHRREKGGDLSSGHRVAGVLAAQPPPRGL